jgi:hypothetical protein
MAAEAGSRVCVACRLRVRDRLLDLGTGHTYRVTGAPQYGPSHWRTVLDTHLAYAADLANPPDARSAALQRAQDARERMTRGVEPDRWWPSLYDALEAPTRAAGRSSTGKTADPPETLAQGAILTRHHIRANLTRWVGDVLFRDVGIRPCLDGVDAMARHVVAYLPRILAGEHAVRLVEDVDADWVAAMRYAYPSRPAGHTIGVCPLPAEGGPCGGNVRALLDSADGHGWARCSGCRTEAVISWWRTQLPAPQVEWLSLRDLRWHIALHHGVQVPEGTIRRWAVPRTEQGQDVAPLPTSHDGRGRLRYHVESAVLLTQRRRVRRVVPAG